MSSTLETISQLEKRMNLSVPLDRIDQEVSNRLKRLSRTVKVHGFRPGKAPMNIVERQYAGQIRSEVIGDSIQQSLAEALRDLKVKIAGVPKIETKPFGEGVSDLEFSATFEVYPEIVLKDLGELVLERPVYKITDSDVDRTIDVLRRQRATYSPVDRESRNGDQVTISFKGTIDNVAFPGGEAENVTIRLGEGRMLPAFERSILGLKAGNETTFDLTFPDDYHGRDVAGKEAHFTVLIGSVAEEILPELNAEFIEAFGLEEKTIEALRKEVLANMTREVRRRLMNLSRKAVADALYEANPIDIPGSLIEIEVTHAMEQAWKEFESRGLKRSDVPLQREYFVEQATRRVALGLLFSHLVESENLYANDEQVRSRVEEYAASYEDPEEVIQHYYNNKEKLAEISDVVSEENAVEHILSRAKVTEKQVSFEDLMGRN
ncbi:MAG: trigger factor [Proteobacteria bacterium]|nr:trigger factor [Pseudomonadota bacterium]MDE3207620.1 trigger factor [Pseudomonadota bacterium]